MSTRSGKRIHSVLLEDSASTVQEPAVKSERKTRNKKVKNNLDKLSVSLSNKNKKRNNYVSYPTEDEQLEVIAAKKEDETKPSRASRKHALKEQNTVENNHNLEEQTDAKNLIRKSRRDKKLDVASETENHEIVPGEVTELPKSKKTKTKKKERVVIDNPPPFEDAPAKKTKNKKKKGKKTTSVIVEDVLQNHNPQNVSLNKSTMSIDSFHSAAGSLDHEHDNINKEQINTLNTFENNENKEMTNSSNGNMSVDKDEENINNTFDKDFKKIRSYTKEINFVECYVSLTRDNLEKHLESIKAFNLSNGELQRKKSSSRDTTFNKSNNSTNTDPENNVENDLDVSNKQRKRIKSSIKDVSISEDILDVIKNNDTFDKRLRRTNPIKKNIELDLNVSNTSNENFKTRKSMVKDSTCDKSNASIANNYMNAGENDLNVPHKHVKVSKSIIKDSTFEISNASSISKEDTVGGIDFNVSSKQFKSRQSIVKDTTFDKSNASITNGSNLEKDAEPDLNVSNSSNKRLRSRSYIKDSTSDIPGKVINTTFEKDAETVEKGKENIKDSTFDRSSSSSKLFNATFEKDLESNKSTAKGKEIKSGVNTTFDKTENTNDTTFEKDMSTSFDAFKKGALTRKSSIKDTTFEKSNTSIASLTKEDFEKDNNIISSSARKRRSVRRHTFDKNDTITENVVNTTYEKINTENEPKRKSPRISQSNPDIQIKLNTTFEKETVENEKDNLNSDTKSSLISSDNSGVADKSDISRISITSDDTIEKLENIVNTSPLLIESSMDESHISVTKPECPGPQTPLKREGTFTKDGPEVQAESEVQTPTKRKSLVPPAGFTPYHVTKSCQKKSMLNVTRSIEKGSCVSVDPAPRLTRVMFCSPVDTPAMATQEKRKIIKSNLKGSKKSFVFDESASISRPARKRSYTQSDADDARVKRTRLAGDLQQSVNRLSRPRTSSATGKLTTTPKKPTTPSKPKPEAKPARTKLPNFAALHQKEFDKMESLDECQDRKAKRAKQLLTPTAPPGFLERISPTNDVESPKKAKEPAKPKEKTDTPTKKLPTLESLRPGFTRFGFKLNLDVNPFSIPSKMEKEKPQDTDNTKKPVLKSVKKPGITPRPATLPSLAGGTSVRREVAKLAVMREKSFTDKRNLKRNENRTIIKGVRTNRRFDLQMKMRNIDSSK